MNTLDTLKAARELISDPRRWTQGCYARDELGNKTLCDASDACQWCALGSLLHYRADISTFRLLSQAAHNIHDAKADSVNDRLGHAAVLKMFDAAIALAEKEGDHP